MTPRPYTCLAILLLSALVLSGCATAADGPAQTAAATVKSDKACFDPDDVLNFKYQKRNSMMVETRRAKFLLTLSGVCPDLDSANGIGFTDVYAGDICSNTRATLVYNGMSFGRQSCRIANVEVAPEAAPGKTTVAAPEKSPS
ncbi:MAG: hypothetical protein JNK21_01755 [Rhodospirillaceae bacterium]|nr:hypothetical protein [Rhodospirillaceae bacterium]